MGRFEESSFDTPAEGTSVSDDNTLFVNGGFQSYRNNKKVNTGNPIGCDGIKRPHTPAIVRVNMQNGDVKHLCQDHYAQAQKLQSHVIGSEMWIHKGAETANTLRADKVINNSNSKADEAEKKFYDNEEFEHVNPTGRPRSQTKKVDGEEVENPVQTVLEHVNTHGGHAQSDDVTKMNIVKTAAEYAGYPRGTNTDEFGIKFHTKASELGMTNPIERENLFAKFRNGDEKANKPSEIDAAAEAYNQSFEGNSYNETDDSDLQSDIPSASDVGKKSIYTERD